MHLTLTGRLGLICDMLPSGRCLCDVGTDHALVPAVAVLDGKYAHAVASDIRPGPLERAARTLRRHDLEARIELRLGAGLEPVAPGECDGIVIAGMGALMITGILTQGAAVAKEAACILLQPMHAQEKLRPWLRANGYALLDERLAQEGEKRYQVLAVRYDGASGSVPAVDEPPCHALSAAPAVPVRGEPPFPGLPADPADPLYDRVGWGTLRGERMLVAAWVHDWTVRQRRIVDGLRQSGRNPDALDEEASVLRGLEACLAVVADAAAGMEGACPSDGGCGLVTDGFQRQGRHGGPA